MSLAALQSTQIHQLIPIHQSVFSNEDILKFSTTRTNTMEKFIKESLASDRQYFEQQAYTLKGIIKLLQEKKSLITEKLELNTREQVLLEQEHVQAEEEKIKHSRYVPVQDEAQIHKQIADAKQQILQLNKMRYEEAQSIEISEFEKINIKNKDKDSPLNDLFIWVLQILYKEAASNYYWHNFKKEVFVNDKGVDFKERLGRIKAVDMKQEEIEKTQNVLKLKEKILTTELTQIGALKPQVDRVFKIIDLIMQTEDLSIQVHKFTKDLQILTQEKQQNVQDSDRVSNRIQVIAEKKEFITFLTREYREFILEFESKIASYEQAQLVNQKFIDQLDRLFFNLDYSKTYEQHDVQHFQMNNTPAVQEQIFEIQQPKQHQTTQEVNQGYDATNNHHDQNPHHLEIQEVQHQQQGQQDQQFEVTKVNLTPGLDYNEIKETNIQENKTGGCDACTIF